MLSVKKLWRDVKPWVEIGSWLIATVATIISFSPRIKVLSQNLTAILAPRLVPVSPYLWLVKYVFLGIAIYLGIVLANRWRHGNSLLITLQDNFTLEILDAEGRSARFRQMTRLQANAEGIKSYKHLFRAAGSPGPPVIALTDHHYEVVPRDDERGMKVWELMFIPPLPKGTKVWQRFESMMTDSFISKREYIEHDVMYPEKKLIMEVCFDKNRLPTIVTAQRVRGLLTLNEATLQVVSDKSTGPRVTWNVKRPRLGDTYRIEWEHE